MCGIVGYISKWKSGGFLQQQQKIIYQMIFADQLRGSDATGVIGVMKDGEFSIMKEASDGYTFNSTFIDSPLDKKLYKEGLAVIAHNRAKTIGENSDVNAHPFVEDKTFAMVHNGTLRNHKAMHDTEVDSHALTIAFKKAMDEEDWKPAMEKALGQINGAFACVWYDQKRHQVCMIRNSERPLCLLHTQSGYVFASEGAMAMWICQRNGEKVDKVVNLEVHKLYQFDLKSTGGDYSETFLSPIAPKAKGFRNGVGTGTAPTAGTATEEHCDQIVNRLVDPPEENGRIPVTKSQYKRLNTKLVGQNITFWLEDYVDVVNDSGGKCTQALVMGVNLDGAFDLCEYHHYIRATIDLAELGLKESDFYGALLMSGEVYTTEFRKDEKAIVVKCKNIQVQAIHGSTVS